MKFINYQSQGSKIHSWNYRIMPGNALFAWKNTLWVIFE
jgi:hypothetical protein